MFRSIKKISIGLLISIVDESYHTNFVKQSEMYDSTYSYNLHPN